ncbi:hypothetical protein Tco_0010024 [Tanacetum coccineum]
MSEEDQTVEVVPPVKSDMHSYSSTMTAKDVKALALKHNIPLDLHPVALTAEWTMDKLTDDFIGLYEQYFEFFGVSIQSKAVNRLLDLNRVRITFSCWVGHHLGVPWISSSFQRYRGKCCHDVRVSTISLSGWCYYWSGRCPFRSESYYPTERKARAAIKKRAERKRAADGEGGSKGKTKRGKVSAVRAEEEDSTKEASSASPLRAVEPNPSVLLKDVDDVETVESRKDEHVSIPRHDSANISIHNYDEDHDESFHESEGHGLAMTETVDTHHANVLPQILKRQLSKTLFLWGPKLARKDSALVFSDRISNKRAAEKERLVSQLSHEYKESLSVPFNLAIQAGWAKGLAMKQSEEDLMDVLREVQGFDPHSDTRMTEVLKMYPFLLQGCPTKVNPSSKVTSASRAVPSKVIPTTTTTSSKVTPSVTRSDKNLDPSHPLDSSKSAPKRG